MRITFFSSFLLTFFWLPQSLLSQLIFLHIPKTGGITVSSTVENFIPQRGLGVGRFYSTHSDYRQVLTRFSSVSEMFQKCKVFTFLRDPIDRVISEHKFVMSKHQGRNLFLSIHHLPRNQDPLYSVKNEMCKILSGLNRADPEAAHLEKAKNFIDHCFFVGISEEMENSLAILCHKLGFPNPTYISQFNATFSEEIFSDQIRQEIAERNWADIELYQYAKKRFEKDYAEWKSESNERACEAHLIEDRILFSFDQPVNGYGWAARNDGFYASKKGQRWVYQTNEASLFFRLDASHDYFFRLQVIIPQLLMNDMELYVNDTLISIQPSFMGPSLLKSHPYIEYTGVIAKEVLEFDQQTKIVIKLKESIDDPFKINLLSEWKNKRKRDNCSRGIFACEFLEINVIKPVSTIALLEE